MLSLPEELIDKVIELSANYTFARYPDVSEKIPYEEYDEEIAKERIEIAYEMFETLKGKHKDLLEDK